MTRTVLAVCLAMSFPFAAVAGPSSRQEMDRDRAALRDDFRDARVAEELLREFDRAVATRNGRALAIVERRVHDAFSDEINETSREMTEAGRDIQQAHHDARREHRELAWDARRRDRRDFEEDRRDLQDARRDAADAREDLESVKQRRARIIPLSADWNRLMGLHRPEWIQRKHAILVELVELARREIGSDMNELRDDRGERRDERREWHEDHQ